MKEDQKLVTCSELSAIITERRGDIVTERQIRYNELSWGLVPARRSLNRKVVRYHLATAMIGLRRAGVIQAG